MFVFNLLKKDPRRRWSAEEALASNWISRYAPGSRGPTPAPSTNDLSLEDDSPIRTKLVSSMRDYVSYGTLRRIALMVVAYHQSPETLAVLRREFLEFDKVGVRCRGRCFSFFLPCYRSSEADGRCDSRVLSGKSTPLSLPGSWAILFIRQHAGSNSERARDGIEVRWTTAPPCHRSS